MNSAQIKELDKQHVLPTYARFDLVVKEGQGATVKDAEGNAYIDLGAGIGVSSLGYNDKEWADAVCAQAHSLPHISNLYYHIPGTTLAQKLTTASGMDKVIFCNSGAESNEIAIKVARKRSHDKYEDDTRSTIITLENSFHGRTITTLAATGQDVFHKHFAPFTEGFVHCPANDLDAMKALIDDKTCGIMIECVQGEGGVVALDEDFVKGCEALCKEHDLTFICDEIQSGMGRTGKLFAYMHYGVNPDVVTVAKGIAGGIPMGCALLSKETAPVFGLSDHGTTFGANVLASAGANVVIDRVMSPGFLAEVTRKSEYLREQLGKLPKVDEVRGLGLMLGVQLKGITGKMFADEALRQGLLVLTAKDAVRLLPPLVITDEELEKAVAIFINVLKLIEGQESK